MPDHTRPFDLHAAVRRDMLEHGFTIELSDDAARQVAALNDTPRAPNGSLRDLRYLLWSSIDNDDTCDLDQIEIAEPLAGGAVRLRVGIADVDALVPAGSPLDVHAAANTTSVYTGVETFPMLPPRLSTDLTSLGQDVDRAAVVVDMVVQPDGTVSTSDVYQALVRNRAKLAYNSVGSWFDGSAAAPPLVATSAELASQLRLQQQVARRLRAQRARRGALELETIEATPVMRDGRVADLELTRKNDARDLIEDFMIAANIAMAHFLAAKHRSSILRVVRTPKSWPRIVELAHALGETLPAEPDGVALAAFLSRRRAADPERFADLSLAIVKLLGPGEYVLDHADSGTREHFGLAVHDYTHSTAPNRRYADLVIQRLVKATIAAAPPPDSDDALAAIAAHCTLKENDARSVERLARKQVAAVLLADRIGATFSAIVTGVTDKGTFVRLIHPAPAAEGRLTDTHQRVDVGDKVRVRLVATNPEKGFIDFELLPGKP